MSKFKIKLKNPLKNKYSEFYLDSLISQIKPLNVRSVLIIGGGNVLEEKFKKVKMSNVELVKFEDKKLNFKMNSFDMVICADKLGADKSVYKEAVRISRKYIVVSWNLNLNSLMGKDQGMKTVKVKGVKILAKKLVINKYLVIVKKLG